jgi:hypothetical protein
VTNYLADRRRAISDRRPRSLSLGHGAHDQHDQARRDRDGHFVSRSFQLGSTATLAALPAMSLTPVAPFTVELKASSVVVTDRRRGDV